MATVSVSSFDLACKAAAKPPKRGQIQPSRSLVPAATITVESVVKPGKMLSMLTLGQRRIPPTMRALRRACGKTPFLIRAF